MSAHHKQPWRSGLASSEHPEQRRKSEIGGDTNKSCIREYWPDRTSCQDVPQIRTRKWTRNEPALVPARSGASCPSRRRLGWRPTYFPSSWKLPQLVRVENSSDSFHCLPRPFIMCTSVMGGASAITRRLAPNVCVWNSRQVLFSMKNSPSVELDKRRAREKIGKIGDTADGLIDGCRRWRPSCWIVLSKHSEHQRWVRWMLETIEKRN